MSNSVQKSLVQSQESQTKPSSRLGKHAVVIGATGLVGTYLVEALAKKTQARRATDEAGYEQVICIVRRIPNENKYLSYARVSYEQLADFNDLPSFIIQLKQKYAWSDADVFSCLGTTQKDAGSKQKFYDIDYGYNFAFASQLSALGAKRLYLLSSLGADANAKTSFYLKTKGELEKAVSQLNFEHIFVFRPSLLLGKHKGRKLENVSQSLFGLVKPFYPKHANSRPIEAKRVAQSMCLVASEYDLEFAEQYKLAVRNHMKIISNTAMLKMTTIEDI